MQSIDSKTAGQTIRKARTNNIKQCPKCGVPLNYQRPNLPNTPRATPNGTIICARCDRMKSNGTRKETTRETQTGTAATTPDGSNKPQPNFTTRPKK